jgi:hypothetical protein
LGQDHRTILLTPDELAVAFRAYSSMVSPARFPLGKVTGCITMDDDAAIVTMESLADDDVTLEASFTFKGTDGFGPMIQFCLENDLFLQKDRRKA